MQVALKRLRLDPAVGIDAVRRLMATLDALDHQHLVRVRRIEGAPTEPVLVCDYAESGSLAELLRARDRLDPGEVVTVIGPVAEALAAVHGRGARARCRDSRERPVHPGRPATAGGHRPVVGHGGGQHGRDPRTDRPSGDRRRRTDRAVRRLRPRRDRVDGAHRHRRHRPTAAAVVGQPRDTARAGARRRVRTAGRPRPQARRRAVRRHDLRGGGARGGAISDRPRARRPGRVRPTSRPGRDGRRRSLQTASTPDRPPRVGPSAAQRGRHRSADRHRTSAPPGGPAARRAGHHEVAPGGRGRAGARRRRRVGWGGTWSGRGADSHGRRAAQHAGGRDGRPRPRPRRRVPRPIRPR